MGEFSKAKFMHFNLTCDAGQAHGYVFCLSLLLLTKFVQNGNRAAPMGDRPHPLDLQPQS